MSVETDWASRLHRIREREIETVFGNCPAHLFLRGLEIGGGNGFQSSLLARYVRSLVCTDYNPQRLLKQDTETIEYRICDAELIDTYFGVSEFDLVFSSNLLEHLPKPILALRGTHKILKDDGIAIHVVPNTLWKVCHVLFYNPNRLRRWIGRLRNPRMSMTHAASKQEVRLGSRNNPKTQAPMVRSRLWPLPSPHGVCNGHIAEFQAVRHRRWLSECAQAGFAVVTTLKGPLTSGYGFGLDRLTDLLERVGLSSETVYVLVKAGMDSPNRRHFLKSV